MVPPNFGRSINPILYKGADYAHYITTLPHRIFIHSYGPVSSIIYGRRGPIQAERMIYIPLSESPSTTSPYQRLPPPNTTCWREGAKAQRHPAYNRLAYKAGASSLDPCKVIVFPFFNANISLSEIQRYLFSRVHMQGRRKV